MDFGAEGCEADNLSIVVSEYFQMRRKMAVKCYDSSSWCHLSIPHRTNCFSCMLDLIFAGLGRVRRGNEAYSNEQQFTTKFLSDESNDINFPGFEGVVYGSQLIAMSNDY